METINLASPGPKIHVGSSYIDEFNNPPSLCVGMFYQNLSNNFAKLNSVHHDLPLLNSRNFLKAVLSFEPGGLNIPEHIFNKIIPEINHTTTSLIYILLWSICKDSQALSFNECFHRLQKLSKLSADDLLESLGHLDSLYLITIQDQQISLNINWPSR